MEAESIRGAGIGHEFEKGFTANVSSVTDQPAAP